MLSYRARSAAPPAQAWSLVARPGRWHEWAPHVRGAWGLGEPEVKVGARGAARLLGAFPVPAVVTAKEAGRSWTWAIGPVSLVHGVTPLGTGSEVSVQITAPGPLETALGVTYGPLVALLVRRLARVAESA